MDWWIGSESLIDNSRSFDSKTRYEHAIELVKVFQDYLSASQTLKAISPGWNDNFPSGQVFCIPLTYIPLNHLRAILHLVLHACSLPRVRDFYTHKYFTLCDTLKVGFEQLISWCYPALEGTILLPSSEHVILYYFLSIKLSALSIHYGYLIKTFSEDPYGIRPAWVL